VTCGLHEVVEELGSMVNRISGSAPRITDIEHDSRRVGPSTLFACIPGESTDGHFHAESAIEAGAVALLTQRPLDLGVAEIEVESVRRAVGPAASLIHGHPSRKMSVVGITGTNGKTTTVRILSGVLRRLGELVHEIGTLTGARTTPEAPELQRELALALAGGDSSVAMEVSSHALDLHRVDGTRFKVVAFTNLGMDHLDHHGTIEAYFDAKAKLFTPEFADIAVIDATSQAGEELAKRCSVPSVIVSRDSIETLGSGPRSTLFQWRGVTVDLPLGGAFNVANAVLAAEIAVALGHGAAEVAGALAASKPVPGRFETIDEGQDFTVIVDYAHTPDGLAAVLETARQVTEGKLVVVFGAGGDRDRGKRPRMGEIARRWADRVVVTSDNPRSESPLAIMTAIVAGMERPPELIEPDRRTAIRHALAGARTGDVVLVAGKGHETTQTIGDQVIEFDDRQVVREELERREGRLS